MIYIVPVCDEGPDARFALQAIPQTSLAVNLAKAVLRVDSLAEITLAMQRAHALATSGEPGPVVVLLGASSEAGPREVHAAEPAAGTYGTGQSTL